jgi:hypothetical protein
MTVVAGKTRQSMKLLQTEHPGLFSGLCVCYGLLGRPFLIRAIGSAEGRNATSALKIKLA